jgi:hypothetical protein
VVYERNERWLGFFNSVAARIVSDLRPATALDVGCALGLLVEALRDRGVDAHGFDVSEYAIAQVREDVRPYCRVADLLTPLSGHFDLVTCIEVLEHLPAESADAAVANICSVTDDVLFTSTPDDFREETHVNVRPPEYWAELFGRHGFARDVSFDGTFLAGWATRYRRLREPWHRHVGEYEREWWRLTREARDRNALVIEQRDRISQLEHELESLRDLLMTVATPEIERLQEQLTEKEVELSAYEGSAAVRIALSAHSLADRLAPRGTGRRALVGALARRLRRGTAS